MRPQGRLVTQSAARRWRYDANDGEGWKEKEGGGAASRGLRISWVLYGRYASSHEGEQATREWVGDVVAIETFLWKSPLILNYIRLSLSFI